MINRNKLQQALDKLDLRTDAAMHDSWERYLAMLAKWNRTYNLTALSHPDDMLVRHLLDSLAVAPFVHGQRIADVGSGAGLPGLPLAILYPHKEFVLIDSSLKKTHFLGYVTRHLSLKHVQVCHTRVEHYHPQPACDQVLSRAFSSLASFHSSSRHLCTPDHGELLALKGAFPETELESAGISHYHYHPLTVPFLQARRCLLRLPA